MNHNEKEKMAQLIVFPQQGVIPVCNDSADFVHNYDQIFDEDLKEIVNHQNLDQLFRNIHGVMIGFVPCIWIRQQGNRYKIYYIANNRLDKEMEKANERYENKKNKTRDR